MRTKLTLTIEQSVIEKAKIYARKNEIGLSDLIEDYLKALINEKSVKENELSPIVSSLKGSFKMPKDFDYRKTLTDYLAEKYCDEISI